MGDDFREGVDGEGSISIISNSSGDKLDLVDMEGKPGDSDPRGNGPAGATSAKKGEPAGKEVLEAGGVKGMESKS